MGRGDKIRAVQICVIRGYKHPRDFLRQLRSHRRVKSAKTTQGISSWKKNL